MNIVISILIMIFSIIQIKKLILQLKQHLNSFAYQEAKRYFNFNQINDYKNWNGKSSIHRTGIALLKNKNNYEFIFQASLDDVGLL